MSRIYVGIDPGLQTGFAVSLKGKIEEVKTVDFWGVMDEIRALIGRNPGLDLRIVIERPDLNKPLFFRAGTNERTKIKIAQDVGANKRDARLLIQWAEREGLDMIQVRPSGSTFTKLNAEQFRKISGYAGRTSEHGRDAAMLILGRG